MPKYNLKSGNNSETFDTGSKRDTQEGKPRYDLIPANALKQVAELYGKGAVKYGDRNWEKGQPVSRLMASLMRHVEAFRNEDLEEDHMAAVVFNALAIMHHMDMVESNKLPAALLDYGAASKLRDILTVRRIMSYMVVDELLEDILDADEDGTPLELSPREFLVLGRDVCSHMDLTGVTIEDVDAALFVHSGYYLTSRNKWAVVTKK